MSRLPQGGSFFCYLIKLNKYDNQLMIRHIYVFVSKKNFLNLF
nr:MAG TPA: hypothetical protein [Caudoviricetes sp.]